MEAPVPFIRPNVFWAGPRAGRVNGDATFVEGDHRKRL